MISTVLMNTKVFYIDRENSLIGLGLSESFPVEDNNSVYVRDSYVLFESDGENIKELLNVPLERYADKKRGVLIDEYFYMFGEDDFAVEKIY
ncbi:MAG: hypothetical protein IJZ90_01210 [Clostridia bacterium]|nr:hypothetical protein [Clostridia bacterium]